jgi:methyl-accepting chemotaxis protein
LLKKNSSICRLPRLCVVAQEVRNLASRSAEAAKEIKNIVENAKNKADEGKVISSHMISGYKELNENIQQTINLMTKLQ